MEAFCFRWGVLCLLCAGAAAQERDLTSMSLEEFLNVEVTSVSKGRQKLSRSPAAIYVITQDDIRRSGAVNLPEALRLAPGVHVARITGATWAIGIRGFNNIYSNKLLVLIDGRTIYNPLFSGVMWADDLIMLEDVERIEVIRGPGATMWGANAVSGVINVITKSAVDTAGGLAAVSAGGADPVRARARYGARFGEKSGWRVWGQYGLQGAVSLPQLSAKLGRWSTGRSGMRLDWQPGERDAVLVEAEVQANHSEVPLLSTGGLQVLGAGTNSGFAMGRWTHTSRRGDETVWQAYGNESHTDGGNFTAILRTFDLDVQHTVRVAPRHRLVAGGGVRSNGITTRGTREFYFDPADRRYTVLNGFLQEEWEVAPDRLNISVGGKVERYTLTGVAFQPTARAMWTPTARQGYWISASKAVRVPAHTDYAAQVRVPLIGKAPVPAELAISGNEQFQPETLRALEAGGRWQAARKWALDISGFRHWYRDLYDYKLGIPQPTLAQGQGAWLPVMVVAAVTSNGMDGVNQGGEAAVVYDPRPGLRFSGSYSALFTATSFHEGFNAQNSFVLPTYTPKHQWQMRTSWDFARHWSSETAFYRVGAFPGGVLPGYSRVDCRIARRLGESAELSVDGQNLLRPRQREFASNILYPAGEVSRSIEAGLRWTF